jgi:hypothetical protein
MSIGFIKIHRQSVDNPLYFAEKFTKWQAWIDLLMIANYQDRYVSVRGVMIMVKRGQALASERFLSDRWKWSRDKVRSFLKFLEEEGKQILPQKNNVTTLITIVNYNKYQTTDKPQTLPTKERKEGKEIKKEKKTKYLETVLLLDEEYINLCKPWGSDKKVYTETERDTAIERLDTYLRSYGKKYKSHYAVLQGWVYDAVKKNNSQPELIRSERDDELDKQFAKEQTG